MSIPELAVPNVALELLPAVSVHVPVTVWLVVGPLTCTGLVWDAIWLSTEMGVQEKVTVTGTFVQVPAV